MLMGRKGQTHNPSDTVYICAYRISIFMVIQNFPQRKMCPSNVIDFKVMTVKHVLVFFDGKPRIDLYTPDI